MCSRKTFYDISVNFRNPGFRSVSKPENRFLFSEPVRPLVNVVHVYASQSTVVNTVQQLTSIFLCCEIVLNFGFNV